MKGTSKNKFLTGFLKVLSALGKGFMLLLKRIGIGLSYLLKYLGIGLAHLIRWIVIGLMFLLKWLGRGIAYGIEHIGTWFRGLSSEDRAGLYSTVSVHLAVIICLLIWQISSVLGNDTTTYLFDFSKVEEVVPEKDKDEDLRAAISKRLDELIYGDASYVPVNDRDVRNVAVDASSYLKDDRGTDVEELYNDIARIEAEMKKNAELARTSEQEFVNWEEESSKSSAGEEEGERPVYTGPSVASYSLDGRKATYLSIPAYRCVGGGDVAVIIRVNRAGDVVQARINEDFSSSDKCLRDYALRAARLSTFTASASAEDPQYGEIVYRFIAQ